MSGSPTRKPHTTATAPPSAASAGSGCSTSARPRDGRCGQAAAPKDPSYRDVFYLESLALPGSILTVPEPTLVAFADHGEPQPAVATSATAAVDLPAITAELEREGVAAFCAAYRELLGSIKEHAQALRAVPVGCRR
jgi:Transaldolase/Fructose-6-phosphate aldolase